MGGRHPHVASVMISMTSKLDWHTSLLVGLFLLLLVAVLLWGDTTVERRFDPDSREPSGLFLLQEWLQEMGYQVTTTGQRRFALSPRQHLLLIYPGDERFTSSEADSFFEWVEAGGTAVIIGQADLKLRLALDYSTRTGSAVGAVDQIQPLLPEAIERFDRGGRRFDLTEAPQTVAVLDGNQGSKLAVLRRGDGWVWLVGEPLAFYERPAIRRPCPGATDPGLPADGSRGWDGCPRFLSSVWPAPACRRRARRNP